MTTVPHIDESTEIRIGHPVRNFVLVLLAVAALLVAIGWSGATVARVEVASVELPVEQCGDVDSLTFEVVNSSPSSLEITGVTVDFAEPDGHPVAHVRADEPAPFRLDPEDHARVTVSWRLATSTRHEIPDRPEPDHIVITATTPLGLHRTVRIGDWGGQVIGPPVGQQGGSC
jgi:hypothetical protein